MTKSTMALVLLSLSSHVFATAITPEIKESCVGVFKENTLKAYENTSAESVRMSKKIEINEHAAKNERFVLMEVSANFYVKWKGNTKESRELSGARMVYDTEKYDCKSVGIIEFSKLKK